MFLFRKRTTSSELISTPNLVVTDARLDKEDHLLQRLFPAINRRIDCIVRGRRRDPMRRKYIDDFLAAKTPPLFTNIEMETQNRCNGECAFCGVNRHIDPRPPSRMSVELFESILGQLEAMKYKNTLAFFSNNEPLLDNRLPDFLKEARGRLPNANINTNTNGTLLNIELFRRIMPSLRAITINDYNTRHELHDNIKEIRDYCLTPEGQKLLSGKKVAIRMRNPQLVLGSRGGSAPNRRAISRPLKTLCLCMFKQFIIRPDGCISLCCNDAHGKVTLGDLKTTPILDVWSGEEFAEVRRTMAKVGRAGIPLCSGCDYTGLRG